MAIPTLDIPLGHLYSKTPYPQVEYSPEQEEMVNLLVNREQYAQDRQAQEAAALTAKVNIDKIRPELQGLALRDISKHEKDLRSLYGDKMNRKNLYNLNTEGKAKVSLANTALLGRIGALEQFTKDAAEADKRYYALLAKGDAGFTMEDYHAVRKEWEDRVKAANSVDDVPWLSQLTQERIEPKVKQMDALKVRNKFEDEVVSQMSGVEYQRPTVQGVADFIKTRYPQSNGNWNEYRNSLELSGIVDPKDDYETALNKAATALRPSIKPRPEPARINVNNGSGGKQPKEPTVIPENSDNLGRYWDLSTLSQKPKWTGQHDGVPIKNADILSIHIENGQAKMKIQGQQAGVTGGDTYTFYKPMSRTVIADLVKKGYMLDGYTGEYSDAATWNAVKNTYAEPVGKSTTTPSKKWTPPNKVK